MYSFTQKTFELLAASILFWSILTAVVLAAVLIGLILYIKSRKPRHLHLNLTSLQNPHFVNSDLDFSDRFKEVANRLQKSMGRRGVFLIGATHPEILSPQISLELAALLSTKKKSLIIEADLKNSSLTKLISHKRPDNLMQKQLLETQFNNVKLWPAYNFTYFNHLNFAGVIQRVEDNYDYILLYAPNLDGDMAGRSIISSVDKGIIFLEEGSEDNGLSKVLNERKCQIIAEVRVTLQQI